jgi:hypothetical protein
MPLGGRRVVPRALSRFTADRKVMQEALRKGKDEVDEASVSVDTGRP